MPARVTLTITGGQHAGQQFVFEERSLCLIGRAKDCHAPVPDDPAHRRVSRHHCLLDINPPALRVRDFGSLNGTFVNGQLIGRRQQKQKPEEADREAFPEHDLKDGDELRVGRTVFRVNVLVPIVCAGCQTEIPEGDKAAAPWPDGVFLCRACQERAATAPVQSPPPAGIACARCGKDASAEVSQLEHGEYVCAECKADPLQVLRRLLELAETGEKNLVAIRGYQVLRELGRGGMGAVYLARHEATGEQVALKVMLPQVALNNRAKQRFLREMEYTRCLKHSNLVELRDSGCAQGVFFFTMEYCAGGSVAELVKLEGGRLHVTDAVEIILQVLDGLQYAHTREIADVRLADGSTGRARGLVHRDLKPQNIFLSASGPQRIAKVGDYGLAKAFDLAGLSGLSATGMIAGTPVFMPRQQLVNFKYAEPEVDVWAAAASLYVMLTGRSPRDFPKGKDPWQVVLQDDPVPIRRRDPSIPGVLADVIDEALVDRPAIRIKTAGQLKRALELVL
jgi:serine/threonine-protein kinase